MEASGAAPSGATGGGPTIKIGSDGFYEAKIVAEMYAQALEAKGYNHRFVFTLGTGHCDGRVFQQTLADTLVWIWRGYHAD